MTPTRARRARKARSGPARAFGRVLAKPMRLLFLSLAVLSLGLAVLGLFLPLLPTVPFVLLAAWAAARSSPRLDVVAREQLWLLSTLSCH